MTFRWKRPAIVPAASAALVLAAFVPAAVRAAEPPGAGTHTPPSSFAAPALALTPLLDVDRPGLKKAPSAALRSFFEKHSPRWDVRWDLRSGRPHLIQGAGVALVAVKASGRKEARLETVALALRRFMAENPGLLDVAHLDLRLDRSRSFAFGEERDLWLVEFQQFHQGLPVLGAHVFFRIRHGNVTQFGTRRLDDVHLDVEPATSRREALEAAARPVVAKARGGLAVLPVRPADERIGLEHRLVWEIVVDGRRILVDAHRGELLMDRPLLRFAEATVSGTVAPPTGRGVPVRVPFPFAGVDHQDGRVTDLEGVYEYAGGPASVQLEGHWIHVDDGCGPISVAGDFAGEVDLDPGDPACVLGQGGGGNTLAARTAFYYLSRAHHEAGTYLPSVPWLQTALTARVDLDESLCDACSAFWDPLTGAVNFAASGSGCVAVGELPAVVVHEWAHGFDASLGGTAEEGASGEAAADAFAFLETRDACIANGLRPGWPCHNCRPACSGVRDVAAFAAGGAGTIARPGTVDDPAGLDCGRFGYPYGADPAFKGPLGYQAHCESYIASAAVWDLTRLFAAAHGPMEGWRAMEEIWYASQAAGRSAYRVVRDPEGGPSGVDGCGADSWYSVLLMADDSDGDLDNGTPNACRIWDAFDAHGIACGLRPSCSAPCTAAPVADAGETATVCAGESVNLGRPALAGYQYQWLPGGETSAEVSVSPPARSCFERSTVPRSLRL